MYDFYYSYEAHDFRRNSSNSQGIKNPELFFKGHPFTERVEKGNQPGGVWKDLRYIGTGTESDVTYK